MRYLLMFLLAIFAVPNFGFAAEGQCDLFEKSVRTSNGIDLPKMLTHGKTYSFTSSIKITDEIALKLIDPNARIIIWHLFRNEIPGSRGSSAEPSYDLTNLRQMKNGETLSAKNDLELPVNLKGQYKLEAFFTIQIPNIGYCGGQILSDESSEFEVVNDSDSADILPPIFVSTKIATKVVKPGSSFVVETKVTDESAICGLAESLTKICSGLWHVKLESGDGNEINSFEPNSLLSNGIVVTLVKVPKDTKPGQYHLVIHDISDIFGNLFADVPLSQAPMIEVRSEN